MKFPTGTFGFYSEMEARLGPGTSPYPRKVWSLKSITPSIKAAESKKKKSSSKKRFRPIEDAHDTAEFFYVYGESERQKDRKGERNYT